MARVHGLALAVVLGIGAVPGVRALADGEYRFFLVDHLEESLPKVVGQQVRFCDKLVKRWEYQKDGEPIRFDTRHFRCAVPAEKTEEIALLNELLKLQAGDAQGKNPVGTPPLILVSGTVTRNPLHGKPKDEAKGAGKDEDEIVILVDKIEKPRERFYEEPY